MCRTKIKSLRNFTMLQNCARVKLISSKATKKAAMEDEETSSISCSDGWRSNRKYFQLRRAWDWISYQRDGANIEDRPSVYITVEYLPKNRAKDDLCFLERCSLLCWILSIQPSLLAALRFGIASLQYARHLSVGCMRKQIPLDRHTCTCYNRTFHVLKLLKLRFF